MNSLIKTANKFKSIIKSSGVDPLLNEQSDRIEPELTEEIDELVKDNLNLVILLERSFVEFQQTCAKTNNKLGHKFADNVLSDLEDIETALTDSNFLNFDLNLESSLIDTVDHNASMIKSVLDITMDRGAVAPEFKQLDQRVYKWINELIANTDKIHNLAMSQSSFYEETFQDKPVRMVERDERNPDDIEPSEIHPDYNDPDYFSEEAILNELDIEQKLDKKYPSGGDYYNLYNDIQREKEYQEWSSGKRHK